MVRPTWRYDDGPNGTWLLYILIFSFVGVLVAIQTPVLDSIEDHSSGEFEAEREVRLMVDHDYTIFDTSNRFKCDFEYKQESGEQWVYNRTQNKCLKGKYKTFDVGFIDLRHCEIACMYRCHDGSPPPLYEDDTGMWPKECNSRSNDGCKRCPDTYCRYANITVQGNEREDPIEGFCCPKRTQHACDMKSSGGSQQSERFWFNFETKKCSATKDIEARQMNYFVSKEECEDACTPGKVCNESTALPIVRGEKGMSKRCKNVSDCKSDNDINEYYCSSKKNKTSHNETLGHCCSVYQEDYNSVVTPTMSTTSQKTTTGTPTTTTSTPATTKPIIQSTITTTTKKTKPPTPRPHPHPNPPSTSSAVPIASAAKKKEKKNNWLLYIGLGALGVLIVISAFFGLCYFLYRRNKKQQKREEAEAAQRNAKRIAEYQAEQKKKAEAKVDQKKTAHNLRGKVVPGLPPPGPEGWEPDWIPPEKFTYMGPLKMELAPPVVMEHELDKASDKEPPADQPIVWADEMNLVYDIGSEVEQLTLHGKPFKMPKRSSAQPRAQNPPRRSAEARNLKAIRED
ncbi:hypothetical protein M3Y96_00175100 [Aphelenchoides besseyi]|nr:hypothetical protein M3Y96_00175100 [Aphelenchoides besseyi]